MRLLFMLVALLGVASASSNCPWKWCKDGKREAESADAPKPPELPPWRKFGQKRDAEELEMDEERKLSPTIGPSFAKIKKSYPENPSVTTTPKPSSENGPSFMVPFKKREAEKLEIADPPKPASPVGPPFMSKREAEELEIADPPKPASPVGPPFMAKREAEELENPCFEQDPTLPSCRKFKRTVESPDKRAADNDDRKEARLPPWRFEQKREAEELEMGGGDPIPIGPSQTNDEGPSWRKFGQKREAEELESDDDRKLLPTIGPSVRKGRKKEAEELERSLPEKREADANGQPLPPPWMMKPLTMRSEHVPDPIPIVYYPRAEPVTELPGAACRANPNCIWRME